MSFQSKQFVACVGVSYFASPVVRACNEFVTTFVESAVGEGKNVSFKSFEESKSLILFGLQLIDQLSDQLLKLRFSIFSNDRFFKENLVD